MKRTGVLKSYKLRSAAEPYLLILPAVLLMLFVTVYPVSYNIYMSFFNWVLSSAVKPFIGLKNYFSVFSGADFDFLRVTLNTIIWTAANLIIQISLGLIFAVFVNGMKRGKGILQSIFLIPWITPGIVTLLIWSFILQADIGILNYGLRILGLIRAPVVWLGDEKMAMASCIVVQVWRGFPFLFLMYLAGLKDVPAEQVEAARIDGASGWKIFIHVLIPHLYPVLSVTAILTTIWTMNDANTFLVLTQGGPGVATSTLAYYSYRLGFQYYHFGQATALSVVSIAITGVISIPYIVPLMKQLKEKGAY